MLRQFNNKAFPRLSRVSTRMLSALLVGALTCFSTLSLHLSAQTTDEYLDFNAAYVQYSNTVNTNKDIARHAARRAYELGAELFGVDNERTAMLAINYANLLQDEAQIQRYLDTALSIYLTIFGFDSPQLIEPLMRMGGSLVNAQKNHLAQEYYVRALQLASEHHGAQSVEAATVQLELGWIALQDSRLSAAEGYLEAAHQSLQQASGAAATSNLTRNNQLLGQLRMRQARYEDALPPLLAALESLRAYPNADITLSTRIALIETYERLHRSDLATEQCLAIGAVRYLAPGARLRPLYSVEPALTSQLRDADGRISVRVEFTVDAEGFVRDPRLLDAVANEAIATTLLAAVRQFRYAPRFESGVAVVSVNQQFVFSY